MQKKIFFQFISLIAILTLAYAGVKKMTNETPAYLYKVLSIEDWTKSQNAKILSLPEMDSKFIHLSMENQLESILKKYWGDVPKYIILKLETSKLTGNLILEANPGGKNKYYHLYDGAIPLRAVIESKIIGEL
jgi:uncharacterized protein (DUF952 family)